MEYSSPIDKNLAYQTGVLSLMQFKSDLYGDRAALHLLEERHWNKVTYSELAERVRMLSDYLIEHGVQRGDRIAILSESRPEWVVAFFAAIRSGAIVVPLDTRLTPTELSSILADAEPRILFVSSQLAETARSLQQQSAFFMEIVVVDKKEGPSHFPELDQLRASTAYEGRERDFDETAVIVYTSGTTGAPKGVMISFRNLGYQVMNFECVMKLTSKDLLLSMLPLNHLLELTCGLLGVLYAGGGICYCHSLFPNEIVEIMREKKVTAMITVPLFLKMLKGGIENEVDRAGVIKRRLFRVALSIAPWTGFRFLKRLLFWDIHKQFGGRLKNFISGGAPLDSGVAQFFENLGMPIYQGYGLTETSPVISVNTPRAHKLNSVGRPLAGVRVRILSEGVTDGAKEGEGEIVTAGPNVMLGYYKREDLTENVMDPEGWFHTGDLGRLDKDGFLYVTGRIKNLIVLGSGKKVNPEELEAVISQSPLIKEICVVGKPSRNGLMQGTEVVCAVVVPAEPVVRQSKERSEIANEIKREVDRLSQDLAPYKRASQVFVRFEDLPKTTTRKIKRAVVLEWLNHQEEVSEVSLSG
jgi:long-chain acyl-CoA synthetase